MESSESDLSVAQVEQSELLPGSDGGLDVHSGSLSSRMGSDVSSVVSLEGKLLFSDDGVGVHRFWIRSHWWWPSNLRRSRVNINESESFPSTDVSLSVHDRSSGSRVSSQESAVDAFEADRAISVSDQVVGLPGTNVGLNVDSGRVASRVGSDEGVVESSESDLSVS